MFSLKDFVKMIWKIILGNSVPLAEGMIIQLFVISAIMTIQPSHSFQQDQLLEMFKDQLLSLTE